MSRSVNNILNNTCLLLRHPFTARSSLQRSIKNNTTSSSLSRYPKLLLTSTVGYLAAAAAWPMGMFLGADRFGNYAIDRMVNKVSQWTNINKSIVNAAYMWVAVGGITLAGMVALTGIALASSPLTQAGILAAFTAIPAALYTAGTVAEMYQRYHKKTESENAAARLFDHYGLWNPDNLNSNNNHDDYLQAVKTWRPSM